MSTYRDYFKGKKITVMGLGLLGRGIGVIKFLAEQGANLTVTDLKTAEQLAPAVKEIDAFIKKYKLKAISYHLGGHDLKDFNNKDLIIRAPNPPLDSIYLREAKKNKIEIDQDASLFCKLAPKGVKIIGVTGTRGKSTVTQLVYEMLKADKKRVYLAGNVRGLATLPLLKKVKAGDYVVMELDSWQLQSFTDFSPHLAIFTSFMNDHQNYYRNDLERYFLDKANIFQQQKEEDTLIIGKNDFGLGFVELPTKIKNLKPRSRIIVPNYRSIAKQYPSPLLGKHNLYNLALAITAAKELGVRETVIKKVAKSFKGLPGRLEFVREVKGVKYYNDTTATTPDGALAALHALADFKGKIILLGGGADKELDYQRYAQIVPKYLKALVLFKGSATDKILKTLPQKTKFRKIVVESMREAMKLGLAEAKKGDVVLLSPGAASFGVFKNEFDRGDQFNKLVKKLK